MLKNDNKFSIAVDNIGALFSVERLNYNNIFPLYLPNIWTPGDEQMTDLYPQVICDDIFTAQEEYGIIEGTFTADSAYTYMSIGVFTPDEKVSYTFLNEDSVNLASLIIDDISVELVTLGLEEEVTPPKWNVFLEKNNLNISPQESASGLILYDITGRKVFKTTKELPAGGKSVITLPSLPKGVYIYSILNKNEGAIYTKKLIIY